MHLAVSSKVLIDHSCRSANEPQFSRHSRAWMPWSSSTTNAPTVSSLYPSPNLKGKEWLAVETVIAEHTVRELFPKLLEAGAVGIIEFPLNKII